MIVTMSEEEILKRLKEHIKPENMMFKLTALNCSILLLVTFILTATGNVIYQNSIADRSLANTVEIQNQVLRSLDLIFRSVSDNMEILGNNPAVQSYLTVDEERNPAQRVEKEGEVRDIFLEYSRTYQDYLNIVAVSEKGRYLSNDSYRLQKTPLSREQWYQDAIRADGALVLNTNVVGRNLKSWKNYSMENFISVSQMVKDRETGEPAGVLLVDLDIRTIRELIEEITMGQTGFGYIQNSQGKVIYAPQNKIVYRMDPGWFGSKNGQLQCKINGQEYRVLYSSSDYTDLTVVGVFDWDKTIAGAVQVMRASVFIAVITAVFAALCSVIFSASFTKPLARLSRLMQKVQTGNLTVRFDNHYKGEIGQLGDAFNSMIDKINELLNLVYEEQKKKRKAELQILHEQIKPHFLYNTLDTIQWMAKKYHAGDIVEIVLALSGFFRISLSQGKEYITLEQEADMVKSYLSIQKFRYEDLFDYYMDFDKSIMKCRVLKLSLQPLVENALYHGIKESDMEKGTIWIRGYAEGSDDMVLVVEDNGAGMTEERLAQLNQWLSSGEREKEVHAYGTLNVNDRIKIACGEEYGLTFRRREGGGTIAVLRMKRTYV